MEENNIQNPAELQPGMGLSGGKYVIEKKIGEGGFGITYRAIQTGLNRAVCIKEYFLAGRCVRDVQARTIHVQGTGEDLFEKYRAAFVKEAQTLAALHHQGIVEVIDIFNENNTSYMVMPFIEGRSLQGIVEKNGPLSYPEAVNYIAQVANAVGYVHDHHILHRDIKPDNIMITADNKAVLIDFGSAREFEEDKMQAQTSMVTHGYAPPEQYSRNSRKGAYTDIYAIGATLYFVLTGRVPVEAAARLAEPMPEPRELNPQLPEEANRTIMKAMQIKPQDRNQSITEFMDDLLNTAPSQPVPPATAPAPSAPAKEKPAAAPQQTQAAPAMPQKKKSHAALWIILGLVLLAALGAGAYFFLLGDKSSASQGEAANHVDEYNKAVAKCERVANVWGENTDSLLFARDLMDNTIRPLEEKYAKEMPEVYNKLQNIADAIFPKLKVAAKKYADHAVELIREDNDPETIIGELEYSLEIFDDPSVRQTLNDYKELHGITDTLQAATEEAATPAPTQAPARTQTSRPQPAAQAAQQRPTTDDNDSYERTGEIGNSTSRQNQVYSRVNNNTGSINNVNQIPSRTNSNSNTNNSSNEVRPSLRAVPKSN